MVLSSSLSMCSLFNGKIFYAADQASNLGNSHVSCVDCVPYTVANPINPLQS